ncbi:signal peptidase II [Aliiroseovarius sp. PTFE2010]|uniref:signal peptidase II n=1 Tax=Aliiroseovarius sp. PTFE2010 TaxID=3417190 RepID=UPI003CEC1784
MRALWISALVTLVIDQVTKWLVVVRLNLASVGEIDVFPPYLVFRMAWNRGVNFGLFANNADAMRWVLIVLAMAICVWVLIWARKEALGRVGYISAGLLVGGAVGNVIDRLFYGAVADFLNTSCCGFRNPYSFNVADIAIFAGAAGLILFTGGKKAG